MCTFGLSLYFEACLMVDQIIKKIITSQLIVYIIRCLIGFLIGYTIYWNYAKYETIWLLISIILVISPEEKDSRKLSIDRFRSNLIGSSVALVCILAHGNEPYMIAIGIFLTILTCRYFQVLNMARVAIVALLIIMVDPKEVEMTFTPIFRFFCVGLGCLIGLIIVVLSSMLFRYFKRKYGIPIK